jgi:hypothetical protein
LLVFQDRKCGELGLALFWSESCIYKHQRQKRENIIDDEDENQFANGKKQSRFAMVAQKSRRPFVKLDWGRAGDLKIMNLMTFIDSAQMFFRNFGLRRATAAFGDFTSELAGSTASLRIIALFTRVDDRSRARTCGQAPENSTKPQIQKPCEVCLAEISFR